MPKYTFTCDFYFTVEAESYEEAVEKGWDFIDSKIPKEFCSEATELICEDVSES